MTQSSNSKPQIALDQTSNLFVLSARASPDNLILFLDCRCAEGACGKVKLSDLTACLEKSIRREFLDLPALSQIVKEINGGKEVRDRRIAAGFAPEKGRDGKLVLMVKPYNRLGSAAAGSPQLVGQFDNIPPHTVVARIYPPGAGTEGKDVFGAPLAAPLGAAFVLKPDDTLGVEPPAPDDGFERVVSKSYGYLECDRENRLTLKKELEIRGDVDTHCGEVHFIGAVKISGSVMKSFTVAAGDDLTVGKDVFDGKLRSTRGSITVRGVIGGTPGAGIIGADKAAAAPVAQLGKLHAPMQIAAAGCVRAHIIDGASVAANGNIEITKEARNAVLRAGGAVLMPRGHLMQGEVHAAAGVEAEIIGTKAGAPTIVHLCSDIEASARYTDLLYEIRAHLAAEDMLKVYLGPYVENLAQIDKLPRQKKEKIAPMRDRLLHLRESRAALEKEKEELLAKAAWRPIIRVNYLKTLFEGVKIRAGSEEFVVKEDIFGKGSIEYRAEERCFTVNPYQPL